MHEIQFIVEETTEGGLLARAISESIFTEADDINGLREKITDAVQCHFDEGKAPQQISLC
jgi:hypothetical protein